MAETPGFEEKSDNELVALTLQNQDHFLHLMRRYERRLLSYIMRISGLSFDEAQDVLQDVFIKAYQNLNSFNQELKFSSWIYRIAHNQTISQFRKNKARPQSIGLEVNDQVLNNLSDGFDVNIHVDRHFLKAHVSDVLASLDEKYREILVLRFFEEKDYKEISDILKKPMGTVAALLNRAKTKFRQQLESQNEIK
ncbi:MAG: sigma-70 family RNA polymerase sigma factor [Patescibacteria group bacterium]|nr:sigma-70 family RNA polymerase sigma factor [Patescibacteria group bacterium]